MLCWPDEVWPHKLYSTEVSWVSRRWSQPVHGPVWVPVSDTSSGCFCPCLPCPQRAQQDEPALLEKQDFPLEEKCSGPQDELMPPQPAASSSDPIPGLGFVSLKAAVLRAVLAQENLGLHSKKRPTPCFSPCKCTVTTCEVTGCYWLQAQLESVRSCSPGQGLKAGVPRLSSPSCKSLNTSPKHEGLTICPCRGSCDPPTPSVWTQEHLPWAPGSVSGVEIMKPILLMKNQREWLNPSLGFFFFFHPLKLSQNDIALPASVCATTAVANQCHELASGKRKMWKSKQGYWTREIAQFPLEFFRYLSKYGRDEERED